MHPILFKIGPFEIYSYGVFLALAFYISLYFLIKEIRQNACGQALHKEVGGQALQEKSGGQALHKEVGGQAKKAQIDISTALDIVFWVIFFGILGGKLAYIIFNLPDYIEHPLDASLWRGGFIFHGGLFLSILAVFIYTKKKKLSFLSVSDLLIPYLALGQAIGRIGCFLNGCCYGKPTDLPIGRIFNLNSPAGYHYGALPLHPAQLYSSLFLLGLFSILKKTKEHQRFEGEIFLLYLILYPAFRFFLDFLRGDRLETIFYNLNIFQIICILVAGISLVIFLLKDRRKK